MIFDARSRPAVKALGRPMLGLRAAVLLAAGALSVFTADAQGRGGGPGGPGGGPGGMGGPGMSRNPFGNNPSLNNPRMPPPPGSQPHGGSSVESTMRGGLQLGPPGRWWDDKNFARSVGLNSDQQHRMDDVFSANKGNLVRLFKNLQHEESQLGKIVRGKELVESQIFEQIDHVAQARGELEKANAHMLLEIRKQMTPEQAAKLDDHLPSQ